MSAKPPSICAPSTTIRPPHQGPAQCVADRNGIFTPKPPMALCTGSCDSPALSLPPALDRRRPALGPGSLRSPPGPRPALAPRSGVFFIPLTLRELIDIVAFTADPDIRWFHGESFERYHSLVVAGQLFVVWRSTRQGYRVPGIATLGTHGRIADETVDLTRLAGIGELYCRLEQYSPKGGDLHV